MKAQRVSGGESVDVVAGTDGIKVGDVVVEGELVLVATSPIPPNQRGGLARVGGFQMAKNPGEEIGRGVRVRWNPVAGHITTEEEAEVGGDIVECVPAGVTFSAAAANDETVGVVLGA